MGVTPGGGWIVACGCSRSRAAKQFKRATGAIGLSESVVNLGSVVLRHRVGWSHMTCGKERRSVVAGLDLRRIAMVVGYVSGMKEVSMPSSFCWRVVYVFKKC